MIDFLKDQQSNSSIDYERVKQCQTLRKKSKKEDEKTLTLELIKIQYRDSPNLKEFITTLAQYIEYPYEHWLDKSDKDQYFDDNDDDDSDDDISLPDLSFGQVESVESSNSLTSLIAESNQ